VLLGTTKSLEELLVIALTKRQSATALWLQSQIKKTHRRYSVQGIYKELGKLQKEGVVHKHRDQYSLSLPWILNLIDTATKMYDTHSKTDSSAPLLPLQNEKRTWRFSHLHRLDNFWVHAMILMLQNSDSKVMYQWLPHPWFHLLQSDKGRSMQRALKLGGYRVYNIIGGTNFLDRRSEKITTPGVYEYYYAEGPFESERSRYYTLTGSYLFTATFDQKTTIAIEGLYTSVTSLDDLEIPIVIALMNSPGRLTVTIENNEKKALRMRKKFEEYFG